MTELIGLASTAMVVLGAGFILAGTVALLRFPDVYTRLHGLAKVDNLGLGCIVLGLMLQAQGLLEGLKLMLVWLLVLAASTSVSFLVARRARKRGVPFWRRQGDRE